MQLKETSVGEIIKRGIKKIILECSSVKFWAAVFMGYMNYFIIVEKKSFDIFGIFAFLALLGIREAADYLGKKQP